jgi:hypothetical protein
MMIATLKLVRGSDGRYRLSAEQEQILRENASLGRPRDVLTPRRVLVEPEPLLARQRRLAEEAAARRQRSPVLDALTCTAQAAAARRRPALTAAGIYRGRGLRATGGRA